MLLNMLALQSIENKKEDQISLAIILIEISKETRHYAIHFSSRKKATVAESEFKLNLLKLLQAEN